MEWHNRVIAGEKRSKTGTKRANFWPGFCSFFIVSFAKYNALLNKYSKSSQVIISCFLSFFIQEE